jgi:hypothetical protein
LAGSVCPCVAAAALDRRVATLRRFAVTAAIVIASEAIQKIIGPDVPLNRHVAYRAPREDDTVKTGRALASEFPLLLGFLLDLQELRPLGVGNLGSDRAICTVLIQEAVDQAGSRRTGGRKPALVS